MTNDRTVKIRKSGHSTVLTVPSYIKPQADIYNVHQGSNGEIIYVPKHLNPFKDKRVIKKYRNSFQKEEMGKYLFGSES
ncbi:MAG TPA: antitoxin of toxin-antitoxin stability system [Candidatus Companilactobacillus pullicola]|uniref:Antitoxin of toxin-antitoxin stability system n=1 Tax=Candidatus Companilactobacillus pullicola TaxID=2838523 RepID=A0A9D1ZNH8_9LACO|nr:antitoxin of toxin-antitoxin stability system [Candidatus Companilactobacillus pullicola]